jgi:hypothetical protein
MEFGEFLPAWVFVDWCKVVVCFGPSFETSSSGSKVVLNRFIKYERHPHSTSQPINRSFLERMLA